MKTKWNKKIIPAILIAAVFSICYEILGPMAKEQDFVLDKGMLLPVFICFAVSAAVLLALFVFAPKLNYRVIDAPVNKIINRIGQVKSFFIVWVIILIAWIPAYLITFPGVLSYDFISQSSSALTVINSNHHPVLHTWLIRVFMIFGDKVFSSYEVGLGFLSLLQMVLLSYALTRLIFLMIKKHVPGVFCIVSLVCAALWFMNAVLASTMIKDVLHAAFLILFCCHFTEIVCDVKEYVKKKSNYILLPVISFFMFATRNNGLHIYVFSFLIFAIVKAKHIKKIKSYIGLMFAIFLPVVSFKVYSGPIFEAIGIEQGQVREALSIPIQQLQRVAVGHWDELDESQKNLMNYYIDNLEWRSYKPGREYSPFIADPAKSCFFSDHYNADKIAFWKFYLKCGKQFSKEYVHAFLSNTLGYWYPGYYGFSYVMYDDYESDAFEYPFKRIGLLKSSFLDNSYRDLCSNEFWRKTPLLRLIFTQGYSLWIVLCTFVMAYKGKKSFEDDYPIMLPMVAQLGIMFLSPMSSFRYAWPLYLMMPLIFVAMVKKEQR